MSRLVNISIDDVSPHRLSGPDALDNALCVVDRLPDVKFTLFVPTAYWRTVYIPGRVDTRTGGPLKLSEHPQFCDRLRGLPGKNFELAYHGHYHGIPNVSNNDEFRRLSYDDAYARFEMMLEEVHTAGLTDRFKPVFRPPAMWMSGPTFDAATAVGFKKLALTRRSMYAASYAGRDREFDVVYANVWPPAEPLSSAPVDADVEMLYHACSWDEGFFSTSAATQLLDWFDAASDVEPAFIARVRT